MPTLLHINDNNLLVQQGDKFSRSQGYAWLKDGDVYFDLDTQNSAIEHCRLEPQQINSRYWQQCEKTAIAGNQSGMRHAADLIWQHLSKLKKVHSLADVVLIVPSHYQTANLQLLLGIAKTCDINVVGLINKAVYALHQFAHQSGTYLHIDVQLHQTVCSEIFAVEGRVKLGRIEILHEIGLQAMQDDLLRAIQNRFILSDRFDPLHYAETEQQLFDLLPDLADEIAKTNKTNVSVQYQRRQHATSIDSKQWNATLDKYTKQLQGLEIESPVPIRCYDFNGFPALTQLNDTDINISNHDLTKISAVITAFITKFSGDEKRNLVYTTELDAPQLNAKANSNKSTSVPNISATENDGVAMQPQLPPASAQSGNVTHAATHLLHSGIAIPIGRAHIDVHDKNLALQYAGESNVSILLEASRLFIMSDAERKTIQPDDRLGSNFADGVITAIRVVSGQHEVVP